MELTSDVLLVGPKWRTAIDGLSEVFVNRTNYSVFVLSIALGIMYDKRIEKLEDPDDLQPRNVPRNVMSNANQENGLLDFMFQTAILTTQTLDIPEEQRLEYAFGDKDPEFSKIKFLTEFANFGVDKLIDRIDESSLIGTMDSLRDFLNATVEGYNYDLNDISDDILLEDLEDSEV